MNIEQAQAIVRNAILKDGWDEWITENIADDEARCDAESEVEIAVAFIASAMLAK